MSNVFTFGNNNPQPVVEKPEKVINQELVETLKELLAKAEDGKLQNMAAIAFFAGTKADGERDVRWQYIANLNDLDAYLVVGHMAALQNRIIDAAVACSIAE